MTTYMGIVKGNSIEILEGLRLPDGTRVEVRLVPNADGLLPGDEDALIDEAEERELEEMIARGELDPEHAPIKIRGRPASRLLMEDRR